MAVRNRYALEPHDQTQGCRLRLEIEDWRDHPGDDDARIEVTMFDPVSSVGDDDKQTLWLTRDEMYELRAICSAVLGTV